MIKLIFFAIFSLLTFTMKGQSLAHTIKGNVVDRDSKIPLTGVTLIILGYNPINGTLTNNDGFFGLKI